VKEGTYRADRHGPLADLSEPFCVPPGFRPPAQREKTPVPKKWRRAWEARGVWTPNDDLAIEQGCWFEEKHAEHFREFCRKHLCLWEGRQWAGKPFELMEWQWIDVFSRLFGWYRWDDEVEQPVRRFNRAYIEVPKKNGKSPMAAAVGCYFLAADGERGGKVCSAASAKEQASIVHGHAINMVAASKALDERCKINRSTGVITFESPVEFKRAGVDRPAANNVYVSISSEASTQEGRNLNCALADELHVWHGRKLYDALRYAFEARLSPLFFMITTAGDDEQSVCFEQRTYAEDVNSGHIDDIGYLGYVRAADKEDDPGDPKTWHKANPSLGTIITETRFREMYEEANKSPAALAAFKRYRLDIWGTVTDPLIDSDAWDACYEAYTPESLFGQRCHGAFDLSQTQDMTAFALMFRDAEEYRQLVWYWLPEDVYNKNKDRVRYAEWIEQGWLTLCPGPRIITGMVEEKILWAADQFDLVNAVFDPWNAENVAMRLEAAGVTVGKFMQTMGNFAGPTKEYESLVAMAKLHHNGNGCLTWQSRHVKTKSDANGNERPVKPARGDIKTIDGIVAGIMSLAMASGDEGGSRYNDGGELLVI
jgi:phage terminase large subunit-like protein